MRRWLEERLGRIFPGMGLTPFWLTVVSTWALTLYYHHGSAGKAPVAWVDFFVDHTSVAVRDFHRHGWAHVTAFVLLMAIPLLLSRLFEGWKATDLGLRVRGAGPELLVAVAMWAVFIPVVWYFSGTPSFQKMYPRLRAAETDAEIFVLYQAYYLLKWTAWEFFFRGFMLFGFQRSMGSGAVLISTIPFALMHVGKPEMEMIASLAAGFILCLLALRSKSIWPGVILHSMVATTMDFFASSWWR